MPLSNLSRRNLLLSRRSCPTEIQPWDVLCSKTNEYQLKRFRFSGCFSQVAECIDLKTKEIIAIKILRKRAHDSLEPDRELAMLKRLHGLDPDNIVWFFEDFEHKGYTCLAFEMLDKNLHQLLRRRRGMSLSLREIKPITQQLLSALRSLKTAGVIHTNIKPHNIMLVNHRDQPFRVKLIDFGSAITAAEVKPGVIMQPVGYRSPDVILGLPLSEAIDMWSLGAVLATMYLGCLPFPQRCHYYLMKTLVETLGQPEDTVLINGSNTLLFFSLNKDSTKPTWRLKTADEYKAAAGLPPQNPGGSSTRFSCLTDLLMLYPEEKFEEKMMFVNLLRMMLHMNPQKRITPSEALIHPFLMLSQLDDVDSSFHEMVLGSATRLSPVVASADTANHGDEESAFEGDSAAVDTAGRASSSAVTFPSNEDPAPSCSGIKNLPVDSADDKESDDASAASVVIGLNDTAPVGDEASESTARIADDAASDDAVMESQRAESNVSGSKQEDSARGSSGVENVPAYYTNGDASDAGSSCDQDADAAIVSARGDESSAALVKANLRDSVSADKDTVTVPLTDEVSTAPVMTESDKAAVHSPSTGGVQDSSNVSSSSDGVSAESSRNTLNRIRGFCSRICCCCCSVDLK